MNAIAVVGKGILLEIAQKKREVAHQGWGKCQPTSPDLGPKLVGVGTGPAGWRIPQKVKHGRQRRWRQRTKLGEPEGLIDFTVESHCRAGGTADCKHSLVVTGMTLGIAALLSYEFYQRSPVTRRPRLIPVQKQLTGVDGTVLNVLGKDSW